MIGPQDQICGSLAIVEFLRIQMFLLWKFVNFERSVLERSFAYVTL